MSLAERTTTRPDARPTLPVSPPVNRPAPRRPSQHPWARMLVLSATMLISLAGVHVALQGSSWWFVGSVFILLVLVTTTLVRQLTRTAWLPTVAGAAVTLLGLTVGFAADTALLGIIPSPGSLARFGSLTDDAWHQIAVQGLPATPEVSIVFLLAGSCAALALIGDVALRVAPAVTALPILTLLVIPVAVRPDITDPYWFVFAAVGYLALLRVGRRRTTGPAVIVVGALVVVGSFVLATVLPPVVQSPDQTATTGVSTGINPLINLGDDLRRGAPATAVTYTTSSDDGVYLRLSTLDDFDGRSWSPTLITPTSRNSLSAFPAPVGLTSAIATTPETASITVGGIQGSWLPLPYPATKVTGATGNWFWEPAGLSARSVNTNVGGETYKASFLAVKPDLTQLRASSPDAGGVDQQFAQTYLQLPSDLPKIITDTAERVAGSAGTEYDQALALQNYFQGGDFTYSTTAPVREGYDGTGADVVAEFLQKKEGYCVHFSSAMAIMARVLGIPSRVAVGFQPGSPSLKDGKTIYTVSTHDLHAWPELYFSGIGWLRFEPTPGRGELPAYSVPDAVDTLPTDTPTDSATTAPSANATPSAAAGRDVPTDAPNSSAAGESNGVTTASLTLLILLAVLLAVGLTPAITRQVIRTRRERAIVRGHDAAANAWAEIRDTARDHGWLAPETETAREFAARLAMVLASDADAIVGFRGQVESTAYGRPDAAPISLDELREIRHAIAGSVIFRERLRAMFLPVSVLSRVRFDPNS